MWRGRVRGRRDCIFKDELKTSATNLQYEILANLPNLTFILIIVVEHTCIYSIS